MSQADAPNFRFITQDCCENCINNKPIFSGEIVCERHKFTSYRHNPMRHTCDSYAGESDDR